MIQKTLCSFSQNAYWVELVLTHRTANAFLAVLKVVLPGLLRIWWKNCEWQWRSPVKDVKHNLITTDSIPASSEAMKKVTATHNWGCLLLDIECRRPLKSVPWSYWKQIRCGLNVVIDAASLEAFVWAIVICCDVTLSKCQWAAWLCCNAFSGKPLLSILLSRMLFEMLQRLRELTCTLCEFQMQLGPRSNFFHARIKLIYVLHWAHTSQAWLEL